MHSRPLSRWFGAALTLGLFAASPALGSDPPTRVDMRHFCPGAIDVPLHLVLVAPEGNIAPGSTTILEGTITADVDLSNVRLTIGREGSVRLLGPPDFAIGSVQQGLRAFQVPVQFQIPRALSPDRAAVLVTVTAENTETHVQYQKQDGVFAITRGGQFRAAEGAYVTAELKAIKEDLRATLITDQVADEQSKAAVTVPGTWSKGPRPAYEQVPGLDEFQGVLTSLRPTPSKPVQPQLGGNHIVSGNVTFSGNISWRASDNSDHGAYGMSVTVWESIPPLFIPIPVASVATSTDGSYSMNVFVPPLTTCFVDFVTSNSAVALTPGLPPLPYGAVSPLTFDPGGGSTVVWNFDAANTGTGPSVGLESMVTFEAASLAIRNGNTFLGFLPIVWPGSSGSAFYDGIHINLRPLDRYAYDVEYHEYGHYVMDSFNFENNPGGPHNIGDCIAAVHSSKDQGLRLAWGEGWPTYWGTTAQHDFGIPGLGIPTAGDATYTDTEAGNFSYSLENDSAPPAAQDGFGRGEDNEIAVQRILWDLVDSPSDNRDAVTFSDVTLLNLFRGTNIERLSQAWGLIRGTLSNAQQLSFGAITTDADVGPRPTAPANNAVVSPSANKTFTWVANVGCPSSYSGNSFTLRFFTPGGTPVMSLGGLAATTYTLTNGDIATLAGAGTNFKWAVEGSHTGSPATGPYLGDNRSISVDRPPVADAGPDQLNVECASHTTTAVLLNGTGSSDPDGDVLTYSWSAPGVVFNNPASATPTGQFPKGTTVVTLTVSDGVLSDTDQMTVRVVDTMPPVLACPLDLTIECDSHCDPTLGGVPATDALVAAFLAGFSATDVCDATLATTLPYPACFPRGDTPVTFTATDDDGNTNSCTRIVHVIDTTPPTITVSVAPHVLWPPNNKLVNIHATVTATDACDAHPAVVLQKIDLNCEDRDVHGEEHEKPDIVGADYGTPDFDFKLRAEKCGDESEAEERACEQSCATACVTACASITDPRARRRCQQECKEDCEWKCEHPDRIFAIFYCATDAAGNTACASDTVRVPHNKKGHGHEDDDAAHRPIALGSPELRLVISSQVLAMTAPEATPDGLVDASVGGPRVAPELLFDASSIDVGEIYLGTSEILLQPQRVQIEDVDADGFGDLIVTFSGAVFQALRSAPSLVDDPITLYYKTRDGVGYDVPNVIMADPALIAANARSRGAINEARTGQPEAPSVPTALRGVYPNPFRGEATVEFGLAREGAVDLSVYDVRGARVRTLQSGVFGAGPHTLRWDGRDESGLRLGGGIYFVRFSAGRYSKIIKTAIMP